MTYERLTTNSGERDNDDALNILMQLYNKKKDFAGEGISRTGEIIDLAEAADIIKKSGSWFSYGDTKLGQGKENAKKTIEDNPELMEELTQRIFALMKEGPITKDKKRKKIGKDEDEDDE